ncbi:hypothetical protein MMC25_005721 [Agyrium rufum]|nr:hypothetical protein [Agyrium rufum]
MAMSPYAFATLGCLLLVIFFLSFLYLSSAAALETNYRRALTMDIPLVSLPVDPLNVVWAITEPLIWRFLDLFPVDWGTFRKYSRRGWHFEDKAASHEKYGPVWAIVTPRDIWIHVADPIAIQEVFARREDFLRLPEMYRMLDLKAVAAPFNESIMNLVWSESLRQTDQVLDDWTSARHGVQSFAKDTRTLSLNVLAAIGFRQSYDFGSSESIMMDGPQSYRDALQTVLDNAILLMVVPWKVLQMPLMPKSWAHIGHAAQSFQKHMTQMLDDELSLSKQGIPGIGGLMTSFVQAIHTREKAAATSKDIVGGRPLPGLSVEETYGNIFVLNFAGHDTTANSLAFAMLQLAVDEDVQEWVGEELREVFEKGSDEDWNYKTSFLALKRCRALLVRYPSLVVELQLCCAHLSSEFPLTYFKLETLRLYPPIPSLPKWSNHQPQNLTVGESMITIPPRSGVLPSLLAMQTSEKYWKDPLVWRPSRWISTSLSESDQIDTSLVKRLKQESIMTPAPCTYFPWSDGPQNCPGARFSQVEMVAVFARLLRNHRLSIVPEAGEDMEAVRARGMAVLKDCDLLLILRMRDADRVKLAVKRIS